MRCFEMAEERKPRRAAERSPVKRKRPVRKAPKKEKIKFDFKLFGRWDSNIEIQDKSLVNYVNLEAKFLPRSAGAHRGRFHKSKSHIVERLALSMMVPGHQGKRHRLSSGNLAGGYTTIMKNIEKCLELIEKKENKNPIEVLVGAISNAAAREEIISYQLGSIMAREAVVTSPQRRIDKTLRAFAQSSYRKSFNKKTTIYEALASEIIAAYHASAESFAIKEKERIEREASGAR